MLLEELLGAEGYEVVRRVVPDERNEVAAAIEALTDEAELVLTTGGTGVAPRDVTPEATASVLERQVPGIAEAIRADAVSRTPHGLLSRGVAGVRGCRDGFSVVREALPHAVRLVAGEQGGHRQT
jgi:molybdopterin adenylyltransferase